jgi:hypothetical protein
MHVADKSADGTLVNRHCPGAIAWSDGDLDPGLDQNKAENRDRKPPNTGIRRGGWIAPSPYSKGQCETSKPQPYYKAFDGQPEKLVSRLQK